MNSYRLHRTNILLGGQMKYDLIIGDNMTINDIHITPVVDIAPYNRYTDDNLLNYSHQENIKRFYQQTQGSFYNTFVDTKITSDYPMVPGSDTDETVKNYDDSVFAGCSRMKYSIYKKQFQLFVPVWLEDKVDDLYFEISINTPYGQRLTTKKVVFSDKLKRYFKQYFDFIGMDNKLMKITIDNSNPSCVVHGLNASTGCMTTFNDFSLVGNLTSRERPLIEFNSLIINTLKNKSVIAKQLFNFNICFNFDDITDEILKTPMFSLFNISCDVVVNGEKLKSKDFFTNFDEINRSRVSILDDEELMKGNAVKKSADKFVNVLNYKSDNTNVDIINVNKADQKYIHWSLVDNDEYIFNLYDGWAGVYTTTNEMRYFSHTYKTSPNIYLNNYVADINTIWWCNNVQLTLYQLEKIPLENILKAGSVFENGYMNFVKYSDVPKNGIYKCLQLVSSHADLFNIIENKLLVSKNDSFKYHTIQVDDTMNIIVCREAPNIYCLLVVSRSSANCNLSIIKKHLKEFIGRGVGVHDIYKQIAYDYLKIFNSAVYPKTIRFDKSIFPVKYDGPTKYTTENTYYKIDDNYLQYIYRYDGFIRPTFIDAESEEYNFIYYKDVLGADDEKMKIYKKYLQSKFPPKFPSIGYYPLTSKKLTYQLEVDDIKGITNDLREIKWFDESIVLIVPPKISFSEINDGSKNAKDIFYEYLEKYLERQLAGYNPSTKTIKTISNLYKIQADVSLEPDKTYKYTIYATLQ